MTTVSHYIRSTSKGASTLPFTDFHLCEVLNADAQGCEGEEYPLPLDKAVKLIEKWNDISKRFAMDYIYSISVEGLTQ